MKIYIIPILMLAAFTSGTASAKDYAADIIADNASFYQEHTDRIINDFLTKGTSPDSEAMIKIQTIENHFLSAIRIEPSRSKQVPTLLLATINFRDLRNVPGQFIVERAKGAGLDLRQDSLQSRAFKRVPHSAE